MTPKILFDYYFLLRKFYQFHYESDKNRFFFYMYEKVNPMLKIISNQEKAIYSRFEEPHLRHSCGI